MPAICIIISALLVGLDQIFKFLAVKYLSPIGEMTVIDNFLKLTYVENRGAAFGILQDHRWVFILITIIATLVCIILLFAYKKHNFFSYAALTMIIAGGVGNLIDRIALGYVIDFVNFTFFGYVFNLADACVTVGAVFLIIALLTIKKKPKPEQLLPEAKE